MKPESGYHYHMAFVWRVCLVAALGGLLFGYGGVAIGGAKPIFKNLRTADASPIMGEDERRWVYTTGDQATATNYNENDPRHQTFSEMAAPRLQVAGAPLPSDVCLSSRWRHPRDEDDPYDTFEIGDAFHATRLDWVYSFDPEWIRACRARGYTFGATFNSKLPDQVGTETREEGRILDKNGKPVTAPWMVRWKAWWGCVNAPSYKQTFLDHAFRVVRGGADVIHVDDPGFNGTATRWGGCFCEHCKAKAAAQGVDLDDKEQMLAFQRASVEAFYRELRAKIDEEAGGHIVFSCNNGGWGWPDYLFDFGICEFGSRTPDRFYRRILEGRENGRNQVFTLGRRDVRVNRYVIAMTYAMGSHLIVPWDVYLQITATTSSRLYGEPSEYADLYGFVRSMAEYLDGYGEAAVTGWKLENWASEKVDIDGEETIALVRAKPGNPDAPVVVHVVDWNPDAGRTLSVSASSLGYGDDTKATLYTPAPYDKQTHAAVIKAAGALRGDGRRGAGQAAAFAPLRQAKPLRITRRDDQVVVSLPKLDGWGIVVFQSSEEKKGTVKSVMKRMKTGVGERERATRTDYEIAPIVRRSRRPLSSTGME